MTGYVFPSTLHQWLQSLGMHLQVAMLLMMLTVPTAAIASEQPNFVIIMVDDAGLMDFGAYGGEAHTPNIDTLTAEGVMFTQFRTSPQCAPSRAMLMTGMDNHLTGHGAIPEVLTDEQRGKPGYTMHLEPGIKSLATRLKALNYRTYITGKWHLGHGDGDLPNSHGFDRSFVLDASGADNWEQKSYLPLYTDAPWFEDGSPAQLPENFYSSDFITSQMIRYLSADAASGQPFLAYLAYQAIHIPVQAPEKYVARYDGVYNDGWDTLRQNRFAKAKEIGLVPADARLDPAHPSLRNWNELPADQKALLSRSMQVNAGMLEAMDFHIGRLIDHLKKNNAFENTVFIVTSDNGPEGAEPYSVPGWGLWSLMEGYERKVETLGGRRSYVAIGPEWATAAAGPSRLFKFHASEGGLRVPLVMSGPGVVSGRKISAFAMMTDISPTILELATGRPPEVPEFTGRSLVPLLSGKATDVYPSDQPVSIEVAGNAALYLGDYKLVRNLPPLGDGKWHLFNITRDPGETTDISDAKPEKLAELTRAYQVYASRVGIVPPPEGYEVVMQIRKNSRPILLRNYWWLLAGIVVMLGLGIWLLVWGVRRLFRSHAT